MTLRSCIAAVLAALALAGCASQGGLLSDEAYFQQSNENPVWARNPPAAAPSAPATR